MGFEDYDKSSGSSLDGNPGESSDERMIQSDVNILKDFARVGNIKETCFQVVWK